LEGHIYKVNSLAISADGQTITSSSDDKTKLWSISTGECIKTFQDYSINVYSAAINPDEQSSIITSSDDRTIKIWDRNTGQCLRTLEGHRDSVYSVTLIQDSQLIISGSSDGTIKIWGIPICSEYLSHNQEL
jgi:WD40 repeat protein